MNKETAEKYLIQLNNQSALTVEEASEGFQLALCLGNRVQATHFQKLYEDGLYALFYDIALNITKRGYVEKFIHYLEEWKVLFCCNHNFFYITWMMAQKDHIEDYPSLLEVLNINEYTLERIEKLELFSKSIDELQALYLQELAKYKKNKVYEDLADYATSLKDLGEVEKILHELPSNPTHLRQDVYRHFVYLKLAIDPNEALKALDAREIEPLIDYLKYEIAKTIYADDFVQANNLISEIEPQYYYGFRAYKAIQTLDEKEVLSIINQLDDSFEYGLIEVEGYDFALLEIAFSIVDQFPEIAYDLTTRLRTKWGTLLNIQESAAVAFFLRGDLERGVEYFKKIDVEYFQFAALVSVIKKTDDSETLQLMQTLADQLPDESDRFYVYEELLQKGAITFETIYPLSLNIKPYQVRKKESHELYEVYEEYFAF